MAKAIDSALTYVNEGVSYIFPLWINELKQDHSLKLKSAQSRMSKQHYPRSYAPGDMIVSGQCSSQIEYQQLALFIRTHHLVIINNPGDYYKRGQSGFNRLLQLTVISESINLKGIIDGFQISKKGVFEPAPKYSFNFVPLFDSNETGSYDVSNSIVKYFNPPTVLPAPDNETYYPQSPNPENDPDNDRETRRR